MRAIVYVNELINKKVVDSEGTELGSLHSITADAETGFLQKLIVKPSMELDASKFERYRDFIIISFDAVKAVRDVVVVDSSKMRKQQRA